LWRVVCVCVQNHAWTWSTRIIVRIMQASDTVSKISLPTWSETAQEPAGKRLVRVLTCIGTRTHQNPQLHKITTSSTIDVTDFYRAVRPSVRPWRYGKAVARIFARGGGGWPSLPLSLPPPFPSLSLPVPNPFPVLPSPSPNPARGSGGALWAPQAGSGAEPRPQTRFWRIYGSQNASRGNIFQSFMCSANDCVLKNIHCVSKKKFTLLFSQ